MGLLIALTCLTPAPAPAQSMQAPRNPATQTNDRQILPTIPNISPTLSAQQKLSIVQVNFEKSKSDAAELAALAKRLREELDKPNAKILSLEVINRAERIEKLAKKIRDEMKVY
jgi:hypothetical protein